MKNQTVSAYGYLFLLGWAAIAPAFLPGARIYWVLATVGLLSWSLGTREWRSLGARRTWFFVGSVIALAVLSQRWSAPAQTSWASLKFGLRMAARAVAILLAADTLAIHVSIGELAALFESLGLKGLGFSLGVALNTLPTIRHRAANVWLALRLRGGLRHRPWRAARRLVITILALTLERGQEIVDAAEARGFSPARPLMAQPRRQPGDIVLILVLAAWTLFLALV